MATTAYKMNYDFSCQCPVSYQPPGLATFCGGAGNFASYFVFMTLVEQFIRSRCDLEEPCHQIPNVPVPNKYYDFIVVGGGVGGSVVSSRLSEIAGFSVLLVEAGGYCPTFTKVPGLFANSIFGQNDYKYRGNQQNNAFGSTGGYPFFPRGKMLGGTGCLNAMNYQRGAHLDLDNMNNDFKLDIWSYKECLPYFKKSENNKNIDVLDKGYHAILGPQTVSYPNYVPPITFDLIKAATDMGYKFIDSNGESHEGVTLGQLFADNGVRHSPAESFLKPASRRPNLHITLNTTVSKVIFSGKRAVGVEIITADGRKDTIFANKEIILTGGTFGSPQIMQLSGIGPKDVLEKAGVPLLFEKNGVGNNFHDHVRATLQFTINELGTSTLSFATVLDYWINNGGPLSSTGPHTGMVFVNTKYADPRDNKARPDGHIMFRGYLPSCSKSGNTDELEGTTGDGNKRILEIWPIYLQPKSRGVLKIVQNDIKVHPEIDANYLKHEDDIKGVVEVMKIAMKLSKMSALETYNLTFISNSRGCEKFEKGSDEFLECHARFTTSGENHMVGTCRMGDPSDPLAVIDKYLRVIDVKGLRICDGSSFPTVPTSNTEAPIMMLAERCADFIKCFWLNNGQQSCYNNYWSNNNVMQNNGRGSNN